jgi:hypothetical protein
MTAMPRRAAIAVRRVRNFAVGIPATVRRNRFPRVPRPIVSRPIARASTKSRCSMTTGVGRGIEQGGDCCADPPVTLGSGQPGGVEGDRDRFPDRIARPVEHIGGEVIVVQIDTEHRATAQLIDRRHHRGVLFPGRVQIPTPMRRVVADVVAHRASVGDPRRPDRGVDGTGRLSRTVLRHAQSSYRGATHADVRPRSTSG